MICNKEAKMITPAHMKQHGISIAEYKHRFPDARMASEEIEAKRIAKLKERALEAGKTIRNKDKSAVDPQDNVTCCVCSVQCKQITLHLKMHGLSMAEYREKFPEAKLVNDRSRDKVSASKIGKYRGDAFSKAQSARKKGIQPAHFVGIMSRDIAIKISRSRLPKVSDEHFAILNDGDLFREFIRNKSLQVAADVMMVSISLLANTCKKYGIVHEDN